MITIGPRIVHRAKLFLPWVGRWVLRAWFIGAVPSGKVTVQWGQTKLVGTVDASKSGEVVGESVVTIVGGAGWQNEPPAAWLIDTTAAPIRVAEQVATLIGETLTVDASALRAGRNAFARPNINAARILESLLVDGAPWWITLEGNTRAATDRPETFISPHVVIEFDAEARTCTLDIDEPANLIGATIAASGERVPFPVRIYEAHITADETGVHCKARLEKPTSAAPTISAHLEALTRNQPPAPHATWRGATVQSQTSAREVSLRLDARDKELSDPLPVHAWYGVPGVSAEVFSGTRTMLAFDRHEPANPFAALWSPYGQTGHVPKKVYHEANEELRFLASSTGVGRFGAVTVPVAKAPDLVAYLQALELWAVQVDLVLTAAGLDAIVPTYAATKAPRVSAAGNITSIPATKLEAQ
jgi:hypothetical protein